MLPFNRCPTAGVTVADETRGLLQISCPCNHCRRPLHLRCQNSKLMATAVAGTVMETAKEKAKQIKVRIRSSRGESWTELQAVLGLVYAAERGFLHQVQVLTMHPVFWVHEYERRRRSLFVITFLPCHALALACTLPAPQNVLLHMKEGPASLRVLSGKTKNTHLNLVALPSLLNTTCYGWRQPIAPRESIRGPLLELLLLVVTVYLDSEQSHQYWH